MLDLAFTVVSLAMLPVSLLLFFAGHVIASRAREQAQKGGSWTGYLPFIVLMWLGSSLTFHNALSILQY